jgi:hypothetical protein
MYHPGQDTLVFSQGVSFCNIDVNDRSHRTIPERWLACVPAMCRPATQERANKKPCGFTPSYRKRKRKDIHYTYTDRHTKNPSK